MKKLIVVFCVLLISLIVLTKYVGVTTVLEKPTILTSSPHLYNNPNIMIDRINLVVLYFVPKDKIPFTENNWQDPISIHIKKLQEFHDIQFQGKSKIDVLYYPTIVTGDKTADEYESILDHENKDSLTSIKEELKGRIFNKDGNLRDISDVETTDKNTYRIYLIVFEGSGGLGNGNYALISRAYLTQKPYMEYGSTFLAHEFYHTLGLNDNYQKSTYVYEDNQEKTVSLLTKWDIMGRVTLPLNASYIDAESLKDMGL